MTRFALIFLFATPLLSQSTKPEGAGGDACYARTSSVGAHGEVTNVCWPKPMAGPFLVEDGLTMTCGEGQYLSVSFSGGKVIDIPCHSKGRWKPGQVYIVVKQRKSK